MRYLMFVCVDPEGEKYVPEEDNTGDWVDEMNRRKVRIFGSRLKGVKDATTVRRRQGKVLVTDGPFAETREWIAGFDLLECANLDEAVEIAAKHPMARFGRIEIRPVWPEESGQAGSQRHRRLRHVVGDGENPLASRGDASGSE